MQIGGRNAEYATTKSYSILTVEYSLLGLLNDGGRRSTTVLDGTNSSGTSKDGSSASEEGTGASSRRGRINTGQGLVLSAGQFGSVNLSSLLDENLLADVADKGVVVRGSDRLVSGNDTLILHQNLLLGNNLRDFVILNDLLNLLGCLEGLISLHLVSEALC